MSINCKMLRHDGGVTGIKHKRLGVRRKSFLTKCLAHDGGVIDIIDLRIAAVPERCVNAKPLTIATTASPVLAAGSTRLRTGSTRLRNCWFTATAKPSSWACGMRFAMLGSAESSSWDSEAWKNLDKMS